MDSEATRILMFHRVLADAPAAFGLPGCYRMRGTALTLDELALRLDGLGPILPLEAVEQALLRDEAPPAGVVLSFDDGYREQLEVVAPLLAARGVSATFYVATGLHGAGRRLAVVDAWYWLLDHARRPVAQVPLANRRAWQGRLDTPEGKRAWVSGEPKAALLASDPDRQEAMLAALSDSVGVALPDDLATRLYLRPEEWAALVGLGMRVGAHSVGHPRLTQVDDDRLRAEVEGSVAALRGLGGPVAFAYPDGACDDRVVAAVYRARASSAVTCEPGGLTRGADRMRLPRVFVQDIRSSPAR